MISNISHGDKSIMEHCPFGLIGMHILLSYVYLACMARNTGHYFFAYDFCSHIHVFASLVGRMLPGDAT